MPSSNSTTCLEIALLTALCSFLTLGCVTRPIDTPSLATEREIRTIFPQTLEKDVDILFMIDDSPSMAAEQANLKNNFKVLINALRSDKLGPDGSGNPCNVDDNSGCKIPNVQIGVISPNLGVGSYGAIFGTEDGCHKPGGDGGKLLNAPRVAGCTPPNDPWIRYDDESVDKSNVDGPAGETADYQHIARVTSAFECIAELGDGGCGFERQLDAARVALDPALDTNPGFIRPNALLAVVFVTDEDDCSVLPGKEGLFDISNESLGPPTSFRCFEYGTTCDGVAPEDERMPGERHNCVPENDWLVPPTGSGTDPQSFETFFRGLKPIGRVIMAAIAGPPKDTLTVGEQIIPSDTGGEPIILPDLEPSCTRTVEPLPGEEPPDPEEADPGIRIKGLIDSFDQAKGDIPGQFTQICTDNFGPALTELGKRIVGALGQQCIPAPLLLPSGSLACFGGDDIGGGHTCAAEGCLHQADCVIEEGPPDVDPVVVKECPVALFNDPSLTDCGDTCPCWRIVPNSACDPAEDGSPYGLNIVRKVDPAPFTRATARCKTALTAWGSQELFDSLDSNDDGAPDRVCK